MATFATFFLFFQLLLFFFHLVVVSFSHLFHKLQHGGKYRMIKDRATHVAANAFHAFFELPFLDGLPNHFGQLLGLDPIHLHKLAELTQARGRETDHVGNLLEVTGLVTLHLLFVQANFVVADVMLVFVVLLGQSVSVLFHVFHLADDVLIDCIVEIFLGHVVSDGVENDLSVQGRQIAPVAASMGSARARRARNSGRAGRRARRPRRRTRRGARPRVAARLTGHTGVPPTRGLATPAATATQFVPLLLVVVTAMAMTRTRGWTPRRRRPTGVRVPRKGESVVASSAVTRTAKASKTATRIGRGLIKVGRSRGRSSPRCLPTPRHRGLWWWHRQHTSSRRLMDGEHGRRLQGRLRRWKSTHHRLLRRTVG